MSLQGALHDISVIQCLNLIRLARRTGTLTIKGKQTARFAFLEGNLYYAASDSKPYDLIQIMRTNGNLTKHQHHIIETNAPNVPEGRLIGWFIHSGITTHQVLAASVRNHLQAIIYDVLTWTKGEFYFADGDRSTANLYITFLEMDDVVRHGHRYLNAWSQLLEMWPDLNVRLHWVDELDARQSSLNLAADEWQVLMMCNADKTVADIADTLQLGEFMIRYIVSRLLFAGFVTVASPVQSHQKPQANAIKEQMGHIRSQFHTIQEIFNYQLAFSW
jgi:hypothetical protein